MSIENVKRVGLIQLVAVTFFITCGGPYGIEEIPRYVYALPTLLGILIVPLLYAFPLGLMVAELATALPMNGAYICWAERGLGVYPAFLLGWVKSLQGVVDSALFPAMFARYAISALGVLQEDDPWVYLALLAAISLFCILVVVTANVLGVELVGSLSVVLLFVMLSPFAVFLGFALYNTYLGGDRSAMHPEFLLQSNRDIGFFDVGYFLALILWNFSGFDQSSNIAGQVKNPSRTFPVGLLIVVVAVTLAYFLPMALGLLVDDRYDDWIVGSWPHRAQKVGGVSLRVLIGISGMAASLGMFNSVMLAGTWGLNVLGHDNLLGSRALRYVHPTLGTPLVCIAVFGVLIMPMQLLDFSAIVQVDAVLYSLSSLVMLASLLALRWCEPELERPFKIPLRTPGLIVFFLPFIILCSCMFVMSTWLTWGLILGALVSGSILYLIRQPPQYLKSFWNSFLGRIQGNGKKNDGIFDESSNISATT